MAKATAKVVKQLDNEKAIHNMIMKVGEQVGQKMGSKSAGRFVAGQVTKVPHYLGYGDYDVKHNSLMRTGFGAMDEAHNQPVKFFSSGRATRIQEREFICSVYGTVEFQNISFPVTPSNPSTFPWLSSIADKFDQWEPHGIVFEFRTMASDYAANVSLGTLVLAMDYDATDPAYANKIEAENSDYAVSTKPSCSAIAGIECSLGERPTKVLYTGSIPAGRDPNLFSMGNFQVGTQGLPTNSTLIGELWVSYDISFYKKQIASASRSADYSFQLVPGQTAATPWGNTGNPNYYYENGLSFDFLGINDNIYFPNVPGTFMFEVYITGTGIVGNSFNGFNGATIMSSNQTGSATTQTSTVVVRNLGNTHYVYAPPHIEMAVTATTVTGVAVHVHQILQGQGFIN